MNFASAYTNFEETRSKLEALYIEVCEMDHGIKDSVKEITLEVGLVQLIAVADAYRGDVTASLLEKHRDKYYIDVMIKVLEEQKETIRAKGKKILHKDLRSSGIWKERYEDILSKRRRSLTDLAFEKWIDNISTNFDLTFRLDAMMKAQLAEVIATRNVLVHSRGIIDQEYLRRSREWYGRNKMVSPSVGSRRKIENQYYKESVICISSVVKAIQEELQK